MSIAERGRGAAHVLRDAAEALAVAEAFAAEIAGVAAERDRRPPRAELDRFSASGLWSMNVPKAYGGPALSYVTIAQAFAIVAAGDAAIARIAQTHVGLLDIVRHDPDEGRKRFLFGAALQGLRFGGALPERGGGTGPEMATRLIREGDRLVLTGGEACATGAPFADLVAVHALDDEGGHVLAFVDRDAPGLEGIDEGSGIGRRTTASGTVLLDGVAVGADRVVPAHLAFDRPSVHGAVARILHAAIDVGLARRAIVETLAYVRDHARPWADSGLERAADDPFILREVASLHVKLHGAEALLDRAGRLVDAGLADETAETAASIAVAEAKVLAAEVAVEAGSRLLELGGARPDLAGLHWRDARVYTPHDPVRWTLHAIGDHVVNGRRPPRPSWI